VLINDILDISKIEANQIRIYKSPFHVDKIMKELEQFFKMKVLKNVEVEFIKLSKDVVIENDAVRFRQILTNLLSNALKYTESGHIHFGYEKADNHLRFYVSDTGIGIHKSEFENIFNRFTKVEFGRTKLYRGAGLGLSISKNLVQKMDGRIWVESESGKGSTFYFTLPYNPKLLKSSHIKEAKKTVFSSDLSNVHILIAENEPSSYLYFERVLKPTNVSVHIAANGLEAVELVRNAKSFKFSLILMDIKMPVMNGIDAFIEIQKIDKKIPIVAQTAFAQEIDKQQAIKIGFTDYLTKPVRQKELLEVVQKYLLDQPDSY
jgi:CheY-like chemotaxis protein/anti-sigma regulatory factor (Ser/Thr protein kinase)